MPVVYNDYLHTLDGDPTTDKLLPLIDAAARIGAEVFCIDAGWYDDDGDWWDSVGEWRPSTTRFPGGLDEIIRRIADRGMVPGLWLEPEVIGVRSPAADQLPDEAFLMLAGERVVESGRYHLDLRHPSARRHLDEVVDRLVDDHGIGYLKLDYNIDPHTGSDVDADSTGDALLRHNRAHLDWIDGVLDRHAELILENCGSGAMRADSAMLSRMQLQSTSDQQDFLRYPPIAAAAPMSMLPEQAANWAAVQPGMDDEELGFALVTGLIGRFFLSGYLDRLSIEQFDTVREAVALAHRIQPSIRTSAPFWPLGLPSWNDAWVALGLRSEGGELLALWSRDPEHPSVRLELRPRAEVEVVDLTPGPHAPWAVERDGADGRLRVTNPTGSIGARLYRLA